MQAVPHETTATKIVVLDGHTLNPGDLDWRGFREIGDLTVHSHTDPGEVADRVAGATAVLTNKVPLTAEVLGGAEHLRYVGVLATGHNVVDSAAASAAGVTVTNVPGYATEATAQHAFALLLELTNRVGLHAADVARRWPGSRDFTYWDRPLRELDGCVCGVVGYGAIGRAFARRARAFGMHVLVHTRTPPKNEPVTAVDLDRLLEESDVVSLHCPLTEATRHLIDERSLGQMRDDALLVNVARGPIVDAAAVAAALEAGTLGGYAADVLDQEPPASDDPLLASPHAVITPHQAWVAVASRQRLMQIAVENLRAFLRGSPVNVIN